MKSVNALQLRSRRKFMSLEVKMKAIGSQNKGMSLATIASRKFLRVDKTLIRYRERCLALGKPDFIGQQLGLTPLSPGPENVKQAKRTSLKVPGFLESSIGEGVTDVKGGTWFPMRTSIGEVLSVDENQRIQSSMTEFIRAQAVLTRCVDTELSEDDASSTDTTSTIQTNCEFTECCDINQASRTPSRDRRTARHGMHESRDAVDSNPSTTTAIESCLKSAQQPPPPLSPIGSTVVSETGDVLTSPLMPQSVHSSPGLSGLSAGTQSPSYKPLNRRVARRRGSRVLPVNITVTSGTAAATTRCQGNEVEAALSPLVSESSHPEETSTHLTLARRWRRSLLSAVSTLFSHRHAYVFLNPVTEDIAPGYGSVVYEPIDLCTVRRRLESALSDLNTTAQSLPTSPMQVVIDAALGFIRDVSLMFINARMYNGQNHEVHKMAGDMFNESMLELQPLWSVLVEDIPGFPALPLPVGTPTPSLPQSMRTSLRPSQPKPMTTTPTVHSPVTTPSSSRPPAVEVKAIPTTPTTRQSKRPLSEVVSMGSPIRKRRFSSSSDASETSIQMTLRLKALTSIDVTKEERDGKVRDVCRNAVWSLSSCKPGHGIEQLLDESTDTFWQSDGPQPHCVNIQFAQKTTLTRICLYTDYKADESYTPSRLAVRVGNTIHDLIELVEIELQEPTGWSVLPLTWPDGSAVRAFLLQVAVLANHQNGRDTHLRAIRLHSPISHRGLDVLSSFDSQEIHTLMAFR